MSSRTRLSLDLTAGHHEMIDRASEICGFTTKTEAVRVAIETFEELAIMALEGKIPAGFNRETKETTPLYGSVLSAIARRKKT